MEKIVIAKSRLANVHPGDILRHDFLEPLGWTAYRLAKRIGVPQTRLSQILQGKRAITADTALRLARWSGCSPEFWLGLQNEFDLEEARAVLAEKLGTIQPLSDAERAAAEARMEAEDRAGDLQPAA